MIEVSIIVPTRNRAAALQVALSSLVRQDFPQNGFEILLVDNGSVDQTRTVTRDTAQKHPDCAIRYIHEPIPGLLSGRHRGAREALGRILVFVDDDIEAFPGWLSSIRNAFDDPKVHLAGGPCLPKFESDPPRWMEKFWLNTGSHIECSALSLIYMGDEPRYVDPDYIWGLNYAIRKETLYDAGGFYPDCIPAELQHFQGNGESGLSQEIKKMGYRAAYVPRAKVIHHIPRMRLTVPYFEKRNFYQGICASYTLIREAGSARGIPLPAYQPADASDSAATLYDKYKAIIYRRIENAYADGFRFHCAAVQSSDQLLEWVVKDNYFDYRLPDLDGFKQPVALSRENDLGSAPGVIRDAAAGTRPETGGSAPPDSENALPPKIRAQLAAFRQSPPEERQFYMERSRYPQANLTYFAAIKDRLQVAGVPVREVRIDRAAFDQWRRGVPQLASFYRPGGDVFIEKCLEHYLVHKYLNLSPGDTYLDVAAAESPWAELLYQNRIRSYRLDMKYRKGLHGLDIGADAADTDLPDNFCTALSLQCAFECFMGDADVGFIKEASRLLAPGGKLAITPLYLETEYFITTSPLIDQDEVIIDPGAKRVWRDDAYVEPFSRMYSPEIFTERIYSRIPRNIRAEVLYFTNLEEILNYYQGQRIYCFFMLLARKEGDSLT